jgi:membrane fusion protein
LATPVGWHVIAYSMAAMVLVVAAFLAFASFPRVATVAGSLVLDRGAPPVMASRPGVVVALTVREGATVTAGDVLAEIAVAEYLASGGTSTQRSLKAIEQQDAGLAVQMVETARVARAEAARQESVALGLSREIASLDDQIVMQRSLLESARKQVDLIRPVAERGFVSGRELALREDTTLVREQQVAQLRQAKLAKASLLQDARQQSLKSNAEAGAAIASLSSTRAEVAERKVSLETGGGYVIRASVSGTVSAIMARVGQTVDASQALMMIVPDRAIVRAELHVPSSAIGFLAVGQRVRLASDAYPYQTFGTVPGRVASISGTTVVRQDEEGVNRPVYLVTATLEQPWIEAFGRRNKLLPGMTLKARIVTARRSLVEWLFEPLYAFRNR